jgi:sirohydrochlorin ferrochelatase
MLNKFLSKVFNMGIGFVIVASVHFVDSIRRQLQKSKIESLAIRHGCDMADVAVIIVDHGSRREDSNRMLLEVTRQFQEKGPVRIVEPAHMELEEPSIDTAFRRCVERAAKLVIVSPFFLLPGRHWNEDIPALTAQAAAKHQGVKYLVAAPLGQHPLLLEVLWERIDELMSD